MDAEADAIMIAGDGKNPMLFTTKPQWSKAEIDPAGITTRVVETGRLAGSTEMIIPVRLTPMEAGKPSFVARFVLYFKSAMSEAAKNEMIAKVIRVLRSFSGLDVTVADSKAKLKAALAKDGIDLTDVEIRREAGDIGVAGTAPHLANGEAS